MSIIGNWLPKDLQFLKIFTPTFTSDHHSWAYEYHMTPTCLSVTLCYIRCLKMLLQWFCYYSSNKTSVIWDVMLCSLVEVTDMLEEYTASISRDKNPCLLLSCLIAWFILCPLSLKTEIVCTSRTSLHFFQSI